MVSSLHPLTSIPRCAAQCCMARRSARLGTREMGGCICSSVAGQVVWRDSHLAMCTRSNLREQRPTEVKTQEWECSGRPSGQVEATLAGKQPGLACPGGLLVERGTNLCLPVLLVSGAF